MESMDDFLDGLSISYMNMEDVVRYFEPFELKIMIMFESYTSDTDIMFENMLEYFIQEEEYEFACVVRDEINRRKDGNIKKI